MSQNLLSAAVVIGALSVKSNDNHFVYLFLLADVQHTKARSIIFMKKVECGLKCCCL